MKRKSARRMWTGWGLTLATCLICSGLPVLAAPAPGLAVLNWHSAALMGCDDDDEDYLDDMEEYYEDREDCDDDGVIHVRAAFPLLPPGPRVYIPFWDYRFHPQYALVDCDIDPEETGVMVDGDVVGEADDYDGFPSYLYLRPGYHKIEFQHPGRETLVVEGQFRTGSYIQVDRKLPRGSGLRTIALHKPRVLEAPEGESVITETVPPAGVEERAGEPAAPPVEPAAPVDGGLLKLQVEPGDASVYIDDQLFGSGEEVTRLHGFIRLAAGEHTIQLLRPGYESRTLTVQMTAGEKQYLDIFLDKSVSE